MIARSFCNSCMVLSLFVSHLVSRGQTNREQYSQQKRQYYFSCKKSVISTMALLKSYNGVQNNGYKIQGDSFPDSTIFFRLTDSVCFTNALFNIDELVFSVRHIDGEVQSTDYKLTVFVGNKSYSSAYTRSGGERGHFIVYKSLPKEIVVAAVNRLKQIRSVSKLEGEYLFITELSKNTAQTIFVNSVYIHDNIDNEIKIVGW